MGLLIFYSDNPSVLPSVSSNAFGEESWSGLHVEQLSTEQVNQVLRYCRSEGYRQGWNDAVGKRIGSSREGAFHPELLDGQPYKVWQASYDEGVEEHGRRVNSPRDQYPQVGLDDM